MNANTPNTNTAGGVGLFIADDRLNTLALGDELLNLHALMKAAAGVEAADDSPEAWRVHRLCRMAAARCEALAGQLDDNRPCVYVPEKSGGASTAPLYPAAMTTAASRGAA